MSEAIFTHQVTSDENGKMLQQVLQNKFRFSRKMLRRLKLGNLVTVNGEVRYFSSRVAEDDQIVIQMEPEEAEWIEPEEIPINVIHEDEDLIVLNKQAGLVVHPTKGHPTGTLANGLLWYWQQKGENRKIRPVTRLDKDTSGIMVLAKHAYAHGFLAQQMKKKRYERYYLAVTDGTLPQKEGIIDYPIGLREGMGIQREIISVEEGGDHAITHFRVEEQFAQNTLVRLWLETGRTHQIRVHLLAMGYPIIGDTLYNPNPHPLMNRQALHATNLKLQHPRTGQWVSWSAPLPADYEYLLRELRGNKEGV
ncbi:RluA family pseudouridine synthase [Risungbinella massiliensis]|uniref:RluA family pseudouridine synthase n=1 Tax=Risungbinella massiliensis TaxID=1329796 RepID=UPI0006997CC2|nr:RluA family pseudouridine synthase [Risungbinella massiliensis]